MAEHEALRAAISGVLFNAANYPEFAQARMLGQDTAPLTTKVLNAVLGALAEEMGPAASCHLCVGAGGYEDHDGDWVECSCQRQTPTDHADLIHEAKVLADGNEFGPITTPRVLRALVAALEASRPLTPSAALAQIEALSERDFIDAGHGSCLAESACALCEALEAARVELSSRPALTPETGDVREAWEYGARYGDLYGVNEGPTLEQAKATIADWKGVGQIVRRRPERESGEWEPVTSKGTPETDEGEQ